MLILSLYYEILLKMQVNFLISCILIKTSYSIATQSATVIINNNSRAKWNKFLRFFFFLNKIRMGIFLNIFRIFISVEAAEFIHSFQSGKNIITLLVYY